MALLENPRFDRSSGPTLLSRKAAVRLHGELSDAEGLVAAWPSLRERLQAVLRAVAIQDLPGHGDSGQDVSGQGWAAPDLSAFAQLPPAISLETASEEIGRLLAATAVTLLYAARAPRGAWGTAKASPPRFFAYWDDWMYGVGTAAAEGSLALIEAAYAASGKSSPEKAALEEAAITALEKLRAARVDGFIYPMVRAAEARGIPWRLLVRRDLVVVYGQGRKQRWVRSTLSDVQSYASVYITLRKDLTSKLLAQAGFPVPEHRLVKSREEAAAAAGALPHPLVVKPCNGSRAENVTLWLDSAEKVAAAYDACGPEGTPVLVECQAMGEPYRITVFGGRAIAAGRHSIPSVIGDGVSTIEQLMAAWDRRSELPVRDGYARYYPIDRAYYAQQMQRRLREQGLSLNAVVEAGREVLLGYVPKRDGGGLYIDLTDRIHPGLMRMAEEIAKVIGSPTLGVDIITTDVTRAPGEVPLAVNEVNSSPSPRAQEQADPPRRIAAESLAHVFPETGGKSEKGGDAGRIPIAAFYEFPDTAALDILESLLARAGWTAGVAGPQSARIAGYALRPAGAGASHPGMAVLRDRRPDAGLFGIELKDLSRRGLPSDHADVVALPPGALAGKAALLRPAVRALAALPGRLLLTAPGEAPAWLREAAGQRRWIAVAEAGSPPPARPEGGELLCCERDSDGRTRALLHGKDSSDVLSDRLEEGRRDQELWALAALLGFGFAPEEVRRLTLRSGEARHDLSA